MHRWIRTQFARTYAFISLYFFTDKLLNYRVLNGSVFLTSPEAKKRRESEPTKQ